jgi:hypothetical protein
MEKIWNEAMKLRNEMKANKSKAQSDDVIIM